MPKNDVLVILPTYNEALNISALLAQVSRDVPQVDILVVDDSSPDGTQKLVQDFMGKHAHVHLLSRPQKVGLGAAYVAGFQWGIERGYWAIIEMDADFSHAAADLNRFIRGLDTHDVVVGCRYMKGGGTPGWSRLRKIISRGGNVYAQSLLGLPYKDLTGGFNAWKTSVLKSFQLSDIVSKGYAFQVELKYRAHCAGFKILEIPIVFENRKLGRSKMSGGIVWEAAKRVLQMRRGLHAY